MTDWRAYFSIAIMCIAVRVFVRVLIEVLSK